MAISLGIPANFVPTTETRMNTTTSGANLQSSVWGSYIPVSAGFRRIAGAVIWAGQPRKADELNMSQRLGDAAWSIVTANYSSWNVRRDFAVSLGYRLNPNGTLPAVRRIWIDNQLVYASGYSYPLTYNNIHKSYLPTGQYINGVWVPNDASNTTGNTFGDAETPGGIQVVGGGIFPQNPIKSNIKFRFHAGTEDQLPDEKILAALGEDATAFRGLMYLVIEDLIVGTGFKSTNTYAPQVQVFGDSTLDAQNVTPNFPVVEVELADGIDTVNASGSFTHLASNPGLGSSVRAINWSKRLITALQPRSGGGGTLCKFDLDGLQQVSQSAIAGFQPGEEVGSQFLAWDLVNDRYFTSVTLGTRDTRALLSVDASGNVTSGGFPQGFNLGPWIIANGPLGAGPDDDHPADGFTVIGQAAVNYVVSNDELKAVLLGEGYNHVAAFPVPDGTLPANLIPQQYFANIDDRANCGILLALPTWQHAVSDNHQIYQDATWLLTWGDGTLPAFAEMIHVGMDADGRTRVKGRQVVHTGIYNGSELKAVLDKDGHIVLHEQRVGEIRRLTKLTIDYQSTPDYSAAPGFKGLFPRVTGSRSTLLADVTAGSLWARDDMQGLNPSGSNTFMEGKWLYDLSNLTAESHGGFIGFQGFWESSRGIMYYQGTVDASETQAFFGAGMKWAQEVIGLDGSVGWLGNVLRDLAVYAGYDTGDLEIDGALTDGVPGVLITSPTDLSTLFSSLSVIYEFTYFNSGGHLKFSRSSNTPIAASGTVGIPAALPADGTTLTVGTVTYRFKTVMSAPFDVQLSANTSTTQQDAREKTLKNLLAAMAADQSIGADNPAFYAGTVAHPTVVAKADTTAPTTWGVLRLNLLARTAGSAGNSIALARTGVDISISGSHLANGTEPPAPSINLGLDDLCLVEEDQITETDSLITVIPPVNASQTAVAIGYLALEQDYKPLTQTFSPDNQNGSLDIGSSVTTYSIPFVMSTTEAYSRVSKASITTADAAIRQGFRLPQSFLLLEPSDVVGITIAPYQYIVRVDEATFNGDFSMSVSATNFTARTDVPVSASDSQANIPQTIPNASDALPVVIDAPILDVGAVTTPGECDVFLGVRAYWPSGFREASLLTAKSPATPGQLFTTNLDVRYGVLAAPLSSPVEPWYNTKEETIVLQLKTLTTDDFASATDYYSFVGGENCLAIGASGRWEYVFFRDVEVLGPKAVALTGIIRAQRGTDAASTQHGPTDVAILMSSASTTFSSRLRDNRLPASDVGQSFIYQAAGSPASRSPFEETDVLLGYGLFPFSPCQLKATLAGGNDLNLSWVRRDRFGTEFVTNAQGLSEASEKYDLEILSGSTVVRTVNDLSSPSYTYTSANQTADGFTPPATSIKFRVYQKGELGRGFPRTEIVDVN